MGIFSAPRIPRTSPLMNWSFMSSKRFTNAVLVLSSDAPLTTVKTFGTPGSTGGRWVMRWRTMASPSGPSYSERVILPGSPESQATRRRVARAKLERRIMDERCLVSGTGSRVNCLPHQEAETRKRNLKGALNYFEQPSGAVRVTFHSHGTAQPARPASPTAWQSQSRGAASELHAKCPPHRATAPTKGKRLGAPCRLV